MLVHIQTELNVYKYMFSFTAICLENFLLVQRSN